MENNLQENTLERNNDKLSTINKYNTLISKTRGMLFSGLGYNQEGELFYNRAYFSKGQNITKEYIEEQIENGEKIINNLNVIAQQVEKESLLNSAQKGLITSLLNGSIYSIRYHQNAIYIEAEKAGYPLSNEERIFHRKEAMKMEELLYGEDIGKREERKNKVIEKLHKIYKQNNKELTDDEQNIWQEKILNTFQASIDIENTDEHTDKNTQEKDMYIDEAHIFDLVTLLLEIEGFKKEDLIKIQIDNTIKEAYFSEDSKVYYIPETWKNEEIYKYFKAIGIGQKFKIIKKIKSGNSVSIAREAENIFKYNAISISAPEKNGKYNIIKTVLPIIYEHEISTHVNTGIGNFKNIDFKGGKRSDLEEGIAIFNQKMIENRDIEEIYETGIGDIGIFLGENFDEKETRQLLEIYFKLTKEKNEGIQKIEDRARRIKMGVPIGEKGSRKKDLAYGNGKDNIKELEQLTKTPEGIELLNKYARIIYSTKLGSEAIKNIDEILDGIISLEKLEPNFPIFAGKIIYWKLFRGKLDKEKMIENDLRRYIKTNKGVTNKQKRLLVNILHIIKKYGEKTHE